MTICRIFFSVLPILTFASLVEAQTDSMDAKALSSFAIFSVPTGEFADAYIPGFGLDIDLAFFPSKRITGLFSVSYVRNGINYDKLRSSINESSPGSPDPQIEGSPIKTIFCFVGPKCTLFSSQYVSVHLSVQAGVLFATLSESKITVYNLTTTNDEAIAHVIAYQGGIQLTLRDKWTLAISYTTARPQFDRTLTADLGNGIKIAKPTSGSVSISSINIMVGFAFI